MKAPICPTCGKYWEYGFMGIYTRTCNCSNHNWISKSGKIKRK